MGQFSQEVYEYLEELDQMNWSARGNVLNQYLRNTSIGTAVGGCLRKNLQVNTRLRNRFLSHSSILKIYPWEQLKSISFYSNFL
jgi:hypothetical protein